MVTFDHIRGGTLTLTFVLEKHGSPVDMSGWEVACTLRTRSGELVDELPAGLVPQRGGFVVTREGPDQADWPVADLVGDVVLTTSEGARLPSNKFRLRVSEGVTV